MPKVISVLEELEDFAARFDSEGREVVTLKLAVHRLELEKVDRANDKCKNEKEMEQLEETWQTETRELLQLIDRLKEENTQLKGALKEKREKKEYPPSTRQSAQQLLFLFTDGAIQEIQLMLRLKEVIDRQKVELRGLYRQLAQKNVDLDAMQQQATRLAKLNAVLRRRHCVCKRQADQLLNEKNDLQLALKTKEQLIQHMRDHIYIQSNDQLPSPMGPTCGMSASMINELGSPGTPPATLTEAQLIERLNVEGKMITDGHNSSRKPRFTVHELRELLTERNELKSRLIELEEELAVYKRAGDDDPPVQGPINREPIEKLRGLSSTRDSSIKQL
ncbi:RILP-like protein 1 [Paragonimus westermani]|uniref:RILP-like protein 1 n=1 Tax=Paragonimus westermani TaxID=34504 RepID=A0A5J4NMQ0_9TREM|nr:RILP-like protein 1 [Paragonimus westermani]